VPAGRTGGNARHRVRALGSQNGHRMARGRPSAFRPPCGIGWSAARQRTEYRRAGSGRVAGERPGPGLCRASQPTW
jgi:hypothetical protein